MTEPVDLKKHFVDTLPVTYGQQAASELLGLATLSVTQKLQDIITLEPIEFPDLRMTTDPAVEESIAAWTQAIGTHGTKEVAIDVAIGELTNLVGSLGVDPQYLEWGMRSIGKASDAAKRNDPLTTLMHLQGAKGLLNQGLAIAQLIFGK